MTEHVFQDEYEALKLMREWAKDDDKEKAHAEADALLIKLLRSIVHYEGFDADIVDQVIDAYESVGKWYA
jgi:hypothetical protein